MRRARHSLEESERGFRDGHKRSSRAALLQMRNLCKQDLAFLDRWRQSSVGPAEYGEIVGDVRCVEARGEEVGISSAYDEGGSKRTVD